MQTIASEWQGADTESEQTPGSAAWSSRQLLVRNVEHPPIYSWAASGCSLVLFCQGMLFLWRCHEKQHTGERKHLVSGGITVPVGRNTEQYHLPLSAFTCVLISSHSPFQPSRSVLQTVCIWDALTKKHTLKHLGCFGPGSSPEVQAGPQGAVCSLTEHSRRHCWELPC